MRLAIDLFIYAMCFVVILICVKSFLNGMADEQGRIEGQYEQQYHVTQQQ
jgi:hypothetical protein